MLDEFRRKFMKIISKSLKKDREILKKIKEFLKENVRKMYRNSFSFDFLNLTIPREPIFATEKCRWSRSRLQLRNCRLGTDSGTDLNITALQLSSTQQLQ